MGDAPPPPPPLPKPTAVPSQKLYAHLLPSYKPRNVNENNDSTGDSSKGFWELFEKSARILPDPFRDRSYVVWYNCSVRPQMQDGPKCGLVALSIANKIDVDVMFKLCVDLGFTQFGEMFSANWMTQLVNNYELDSRFTAETFETTKMSWSLVQHCLDDGGFLLVPYDLGTDMKIGFVNGTRAHWVLIVGIMSTNDDDDLSAQPDECEQILKYSHNGPKFVNEGNLKYLLGFHGKTRRMCLYGWDELITSNMQLHQPGKTVEEGFVIPEEGINKTLSGKFVILKPNK